LCSFVALSHAQIFQVLHEYAYDTFLETKL
jgi:hypothetical protein